MVKGKPRRFLQGQFHKQFGFWARHKGGRRNVEVATVELLDAQDIGHWFAVRPPGHKALRLSEFLVGKLGFRFQNEALEQIGPLQAQGVRQQNLRRQARRVCSALPQAQGKGIDQRVQVEGGRHGFSCQEQ